MTVEHEAATSPHAHRARRGKKGPAPVLNGAQSDAELISEINIAASGAEPLATADQYAAPRNQDKFLILAATLVRMGVGLVTFIVLARFLGPASYGILATAIAYTGFLAVATDFGLAIYTLRTAAMAPEAAARIVRNAIELKVLLALIAAPAGIIVLVMAAGQSLLLVYSLAYVGVIAYSIGDLLLIVVRAQQRFEVEAKLVVGTSFLLMAGVAVVAAATRDITAAAAAFAFTRLVYLGIITLLLRTELGVQPSARSRRVRLSETFHGAKGFATDSILTTLSGQLDVLLFGVLLTAHDIGIYQAGARLVQTIMPFAIVLSTVYMPSLSMAFGRQNVAEFRRSSVRLNVEFTALAVAGGLGFAIVGPVVTPMIYGQAYGALLPLWSGFGAFVMLRFTSAAFGIQLGALGLVGPRIVAQIFTMAIFVGVSIWLLPSYGFATTAWLLAASGVPMILILGGSLIINRCGTISFTSRTAVISCTAITMAAAAIVCAV